MPDNRNQETEPLLLTPGPLTTSDSVKAAMQRDWGSRDPAFTALTARIRQALLEIAGAAETHAAVPLQGSGTFAIEATLGTLIPPDGRVLLLINGSYGRRMAKICETIGRRAMALTFTEDTTVNPDAMEVTLRDQPQITHVAVVHCETTSGILNPVEDIAARVARRGRRLIIDAMSSFGALPLNLATLPCDAVVASANKCLQGVPGLAFVIAAVDSLKASAGNAPSVSLDLFEQWRFLEETGQWQFTPPTQVVAALDRALAEHPAAGGVFGRGARYRRNCDALIAGMRELGFETYLADAVQAPIIVTFLTPADPRFSFEAYYDGLAERGYLIYPGKLIEENTFRIGCIGDIDGSDIAGLLIAVRATLDDLGVESGAP
jgi:2-aminoethylphosphonate-pyruvate transaminase